MTEIHADIEERLKVLRSRIAEDPARAEELRPVVESLEVVLANLKRHQEESAWRLRMLEYGQKVLNRRIQSIEDSLIFRVLRTVGAPLLFWKDRFDDLRRRSPLYKEASSDAIYERWLLQQAPVDAQEVPQLERQPIFSITMRLQDPRREFLEQAIDSIIGQTYPHWELCVYSGSGWAEKYLADRSASEPRIRVCRPGESPRGEYVAFFDEHAILAPSALHRLAEVVQEGPADLIYTDEDRLSEEGRHVEPIFKPDWSPDLLLSCDYVGHLMAVSRDAMNRAGGLRDDFEGAAEYDLALRIADRAATIRHIPAVLYHALSRRESNDRKAAARRAVEDAVSRRGWNAKVEDTATPGRYQVRWLNRQEPLASLVICSRSPKLLGACLAAIQKQTTYTRRELVVVQHVSGEGDGAMKEVVAQYGAKCVRYTGPFHFSRMNNTGVKAASGEILVFLNDDVEPLDGSWLSNLVGQVERPEVGAVGAQLVYPNSTIQHGGITIGIGDGCGHVGRGTKQRPYWPWLAATRNVSAVTGACLAVRKQVFLDVGGFDDRFPINYNDVDLCLRIARSGYGIVYDSSVLLRHYECQTRRGGVALSERQQWYACWADEVDRGDPFYSPNLTRVREDASLRFDK